PRASQPVFLRGGPPEFKLVVRNTSRYHRAPIVFWAKQEFVFRSFGGRSRRALCPPGVEAVRLRDCLKHLLTRCFDRKVVNYVGHCCSLIARPHCRFSGGHALRIGMVAPLLSFLSVRR